MSRPSKAVPDFHRIDSIVLKPAETMAIRRQAAQLHALGGRTLGEFILELAREQGARQRRGMLKRLAMYAAIDPEMLTALSGDRPVALPLRLVR